MDLHGASLRPPRTRCRGSDDARHVRVGQGSCCACGLPRCAGHRSQGSRLASTRRGVERLLRSPVRVGAFGRTPGHPLFRTVTHTDSNDREAKDVLAAPHRLAPPIPREHGSDSIQRTGALPARFTRLRNGAESIDSLLARSTCLPCHHFQHIPTCPPAVTAMEGSSFSPLISAWCTSGVSARTASASRRDEVWASHCGTARNAPMWNCIMQERNRATEHHVPLQPMDRAQSHSHCADLLRRLMDSP